VSRHKGKGPTKKRTWTRLEPFLPADPDAFHKANGSDASLWKNDIYQVIARPMMANGERTGGVHLSIRRNDRRPARDWRDFQRIKNELCGPEREGIELYPAESRLVDCANQYHMWVAPPGVRFPVGFDEGRVTRTPEEAAIEAPGAVQRPFEED